MNEKRPKELGLMKIARCLMWALLPLWLILIAIEELYDFIKTEKPEEDITWQESKRRHYLHSEEMRKKGMFE